MRHSLFEPTGDKWGYLDAVLLAKLGVNVDSHGKMPDVVLFYPKRNWLLLVESVTSHGRPSPQKRAEPAPHGVFSIGRTGHRVPDRAIMSRYLGEIAWETEGMGCRSTIALDPL